MENCMEDSVEMCTNETRFTAAIAEIDRNTLHNVWQEMDYRLDENDGTADMVWSTALPGSSTVFAGEGLTAMNATDAPMPTLSPAERTRADFYKTYDVMTGVRIAGTLGGFFSLMVLLVVYKSRCKSGGTDSRSLSEAAMWAAQMEAASSSAAQPSPPRQHLPPQQFVQPSMPPCLPPPSLGVVGVSQFLSVPGASRRLSSITCSSSDTSYLERRGSAVEMGLPAPPPGAFRRFRAPMPEEQPWDFYYPIDIQVIQPTPEASPCGSERTLYHRAGSLVFPARRQAPLASISTCAGSLRTDDCDDARSVGSDSVFMDDDDVDTEDEVDGFSTDSEMAVEGVRHFLQVPAARTFAPAARWSDGAASYKPKRRVPGSGDAEKERIAHRPPCPLPADSSSSSDSATLQETVF